MKRNGILIGLILSSLFFLTGCFTPDLKEDTLYVYPNQSFPIKITGKLKPVENFSIGTLYIAIGKPKDEVLSFDPGYLKHLKLTNLNKHPLQTVEIQIEENNPAAIKPFFSSYPLPNNYEWKTFKTAYPLSLNELEKNSNYLVTLECQYRSKDNKGIYSIHYLPYFAYISKNNTSITTTGEVIKRTVVISNPPQASIDNIKSESFYGPKSWPGKIEGQVYGKDDPKKVYLTVRNFGTTLNDKWVAKKPLFLKKTYVTLGYTLEEIQAVPGIPFTPPGPKKPSSFTLPAYSWTSEVTSIEVTPDQPAKPYGSNNEYSWHTWSVDIPKTIFSQYINQEGFKEINGRVFDLSVNASNEWGASVAPQNVKQLYFTWDQLPPWPPPKKLKLNKYPDTWTSEEGFKEYFASSFNLKNIIASWESPAQSEGVEGFKPSIYDYNQYNLRYYSSLSDKKGKVIATLPHDPDKNYYQLKIPDNTSKKLKSNMVYKFGITTSDLAGNENNPFTDLYLVVDDTKPAEALIYVNGNKIDPGNKVYLNSDSFDLHLRAKDTDNKGAHSPITLMKAFLAGAKDQQMINIKEWSTDQILIESDGQTAENVFSLPPYYISSKENIGLSSFSNNYDGEKNLHVTAMDAGENIFTSKNVTLFIDTQKPGAPIVDEPAEGSLKSFKTVSGKVRDIVYNAKTANYDTGGSGIVSPGVWIRFASQEAGTSTSQEAGTSNYRYWEKDNKNVYRWSIKPIANADWDGDYGVGNKVEIWHPVDGLEQNAVKDSAGNWYVTWYRNSNLPKNLADKATYKIKVKSMDQAGNVEYSSKKSITGDQTPPSGSIQILVDNDGDKTYTPGNASQGTIKIDVSKIEGAVSYCYSYALIGGPFWSSYKPGDLIGLGNTEGKKKFSFTAKDEAGNIFSTLETVTLDKTPPTGTVSINNGATHTNEVKVVKLAMTAADANNLSPVNQMKLWNANESEPGNWEKISATKDNFSLNPFPEDEKSGYATKTVNVKFQDAAGNSSEAFKDDIIYDAVAPTVDKITSPTGSKTPAITRIEGTAYDRVWDDQKQQYGVGGSGLSKVEVRIKYQSSKDGNYYYLNGQKNWIEKGNNSDADFWVAVNETDNWNYTDLPNSWNEQNGQTIELEIRAWDNAGNFSTVLKYPITIDQNAPISSDLDVTVFPSTWGNEDTKTFDFEWSWPSDKAPGDVADYYYAINALPDKFSNLTKQNKISIPKDSMQKYDIKQGENIFYVVAMDTAGNADFKTPAALKFFYDSIDPDKPISPSVNPADYTSGNNWVITWANPPDTSGIAKAFWNVDGGDFTEVATKDGTITINPPVTVDGEHSVKIYLEDLAGNKNEENFASLIIKYDGTEPSLPIIQGYGSNQKNYPINSAGTYKYKKPYFTWEKPDDGKGSGVKGYYIYWGEDATVDPKDFSSDLFYQVGSDLVDGHTYYLRVKSEDKVNKISSQVAIFKYTYKEKGPTGKFSFLVDNKGDGTYVVGTNTNNQNIKIQPDNFSADTVKVVIRGDGLKELKIFVPYDESKLKAETFSLVDTEGEKKIVVDLYDTAANVTPLAQQVVFDKTAPNGMLVINKNDPFVNAEGAKVVKLAMTAADANNLSPVNQMKLWNANESEPGNWEKISETKGNFNLNTSGAENKNGYFKKTVNLKLLDAAGNPSTVYSDDIIYDAVAPTVDKITSPTGSKTPAITRIEGTAYDRVWDDQKQQYGVGGSGLSKVEVRIKYQSSKDEKYYYLDGQKAWIENGKNGDADFWVAVNETDNWNYTDLPNSWNEQNGQTIELEIRALDKAGNLSDVNSKTVIIDTAKPSVTKFELNNKDKFTSKLPIEVTTLTFGAGKTIKQVKFSGDISDSFKGQWTDYSSDKTFSLNLTPGDGAKNISVAAKDDLELESEPLASSITLDRAAPGAPINPTVEPKDWVSNKEWTLKWTNPTEFSGISKIHWKKETDTKFTVEDLNKDQAGNAIPNWLVSPFVPEGTTQIVFFLEDSLGTYDQNNTGTVSVKYDNSPPNCSINSPLNTQELKSFSEITGVANDNLSGISKVEVSIKRNSDLFYWDGEEFIDTSGEPKWLAASGTANWSYVNSTFDSKLENNKSYTLKAKATDNVAKEKGSDSVSFTFIKMASGAPTDLKISKTADNQVKLSWSEPTQMFGITYYNVYRSSKPYDFTGAIKVSPDNYDKTYWTDPMPTSNAFYSVSSINAGGESTMVDPKMGVVIQPLVPGYTWFSIPIELSSSINASTIFSENTSLTELALPSYLGSTGFEKVYDNTGLGVDFNLASYKCYRARNGGVESVNLSLLGKVPTVETSLQNVKKSIGWIFVPLNEMFNFKKAPDLWGAGQLNLQAGDELSQPDQKGGVGFGAKYDGTALSVDFAVKAGDPIQVKTAKDILSWPK